LNKILSFLLSYNLALDFQKEKALFVIHHILHKNTNQTIKINTNIMIVGNISLQKSPLVLSFIVIFVSISGFFNHKSVKESFFGNITMSLTVISVHFSLTIFHE
jgi:hypothetical protein